MNVEYLFTPMDRALERRREGRIRDPRTGRLVDPRTRAGAYAAARYTALYRHLVNRAVAVRNKLRRTRGAPPKAVLQAEAVTLGLTQRFGAALELTGRLYRAHRVSIREMPAGVAQTFTGVRREDGSWEERWSSPGDWIEAGARYNERASRELARLPRIQVGGATGKQAMAGMGFLPLAAIPVGWQVTIAVVGVVGATVGIVYLGRLGLVGLFDYLGVDLQAQQAALDAVEHLIAQADAACAAIENPRERATCYTELAPAAAAAYDDAARAGERSGIARLLALGAVAAGVAYVATR